MADALKAVIIGAGHRAMHYAAVGVQAGDVEIVGVADPLEYRRRMVADRYNLTDDALFETAEQLAAKPKFADFAINGTMDHQHVSTALPLLEAGYHMLLEKPFATSEDDMWRLAKAAKQHNRTVLICHVLRYAPFYTRIRERVAAGEIGAVMNVQTIEHVSYHHMAVGFVRGKWNSKEVCHSSMLMAKCCHDLDLIAWMKSGIAPTHVQSFGGRMFFREEMAPEGAGTRCLVDCPIEAECDYSAKKMFIDHPNRWSFYVWDSLEEIDNPTIDDKIASLKTSPYGRCVWRHDNDVVDHQTVNIQFADGATASHNMVGGTPKPSRAIHLLGTHGEIQGVMEDSTFVIRHIDTRPGHEYSEETVDLNVTGDMHGASGGHGGAEPHLVDDVVSVLRGKQPSLSTTSLDDSIAGHLIGFSADKSMAEGRVIELPSW